MLGEVSSFYRTELHEEVSELLDGMEALQQYDGLRTGGNGNPPFWEVFVRDLCSLSSGYKRKRIFVREEVMGDLTVEKTESLRCLVTEVVCSQERV